MKRYFDYASTTPTDPGVIQAMEPYFFEKFGNPSSPHGFGQEALSALESAREMLAQFIGASPQEIVFNSGATEANNHAIGAVAYTQMEKGNHIIVSAVEHHSVHEPVEQLVKDGFSVTEVPVNEFGEVDPQTIKDAVTDKTILIAALHASNEIGTIQPVAEVGAIARAAGIPFLVDACQTVGHIPVHVDEMNADYVSCSAHKFYGPKGIGALYIRKSAPVSPLLFGGDQERGRRASTPNVAGAVGLARAIALCRDKMAEETMAQSALRDQLLTEVPQLISGVKINGHPDRRLPNNAHFSFEGIDGQALLIQLDMNGIAASMGSACTSGSMAPSRVLKATGLSDDLARGSLRLTVGRWTTEEDINYLLETLPRIIKKLRH